MQPENQSMLRGIEKLAEGRPTDLLAFLKPYSRPAPRRFLYALGGVLLFCFIAFARLAFVPTPVAGSNTPPSDKEDSAQFSSTSTQKVSMQTSSTQTASAEINSNFPSRKAVVLASYKTQDVSWLPQLDSNLTSGWEIYRYVSDQPTEDDPSDWLYVQNDEGREALAYLTFIIDNYKSLPDYTAFIHGHNRAWHQPESVVDRLSALNLTAVKDAGYISLQYHGGGCDEATRFYYDGSHVQDTRRGTMIKDFWDDMLKPHGFGELPPVIGRPCCAQFSVHKDAILKHSRKFWKHMREPLLIGDDHQRPRWRDDFLSGHAIGLYYENIWHILFGKLAINCPSPEYVEDVHFQGLIHCDRRIVGWDDQDNWEDLKCTNKLRKHDEVE